MLKQFLEYRSRGYSVIPVQINKKPFVKWQEFQDRIASEDEIKNWLTSWPNAQIGIVTGPISNLAVIDIDIWKSRYDSALNS